jgi:hypothetical protein
VTDADLKERARVLVERMAEVGRIVYALPLETPREEFESALAEAGLLLREVDSEAEVSRWTDEHEEDLLVALERADLGVRIFEIRGPGAPSRVRTILGRVPFVPQSRLLREAIDVTSPDARKALLVLAHGVVVWDDDWTDLFLLHLASPDPIARHDAVVATFLAAMVAAAREPALTLLREAHQRERFPKLKDDIADAIERLDKP